MHFLARPDQFVLAFVHAALRFECANTTSREKTCGFGIPGL